MIIRYTTPITSGYDTVIYERNWLGLKMIHHYQKLWTRPYIPGADSGIFAATTKEHGEVDFTRYCFTFKQIL